MVIITNISPKSIPYWYSLSEMTSKNALKTKEGDDQMKSAKADKDETPTTELDQDNGA